VHRLSNLAFFCYNFNKLTYLLTYLLTSSDPSPLSGAAVVTVIYC